MASNYNPTYINGVLVVNPPTANGTILPTTIGNVSQLMALPAGPIFNVVDQGVRMPVYPPAAVAPPPVQPLPPAVPYLPIPARN